MSLQLNKLYDPRTPLQKARRKELERFARLNGVEEVKPGMPAPLMRKILEGKGLTGIPVTRYLGGPPDMHANGRAVTQFEPQQEVEVKDELSILTEAWEKESMDYSSLSITELRKMCKSRGVKLKRTDKMVDMVRKLNGQDTS